VVPQLIYPDLINPGPRIFEQGALQPDDILAFDRMAADAWPAPYVTNLDGWALRYGEGVSRRANSVAPWPSTTGGHALIDQIEAAERFYQDRNLPPRFQVSPAAEPDALDEELSIRGYEIEAPVTLMIADVHDVIKNTVDDAPMTQVSGTAPDGWWNLYVEGFNRDASKVISGATDCPQFATAIDSSDDTGVGIGLGVLNNAGWLGIFGMWTHPERRSQGIGADMLRALAQATIDNGAIGLYLQVERSNSGAQRLYQRLGFRPLYGYYYRTLWP